MRKTVPNSDNLMNCPVCNNKYSRTKAFLVEESEDKSTFHITCEKCGISSLVFLSAGPLGVISMGMITDLERSEMKKLYRSDAITSDQVLEAYETLKKHKSGINELIKF